MQSHTISNRFFPLILQPNKCYSADELLAIYTARNTDSLTKKTFLDMCPSLIYQQVSKACAPLPQSGKKGKHAIVTAEGSKNKFLV